MCLKRSEKGGTGRLQEVEVLKVDGFKYLKSMILNKKQRSEEYSDSLFM